MKVVNEKGKLFGIINVVDLLVVLFVLLVAGGVMWKLFGPRVAATVAPKTEVLVTTRLRGSFMRIYDSMASFGFPQQVAAGDGFVDGAELVEMRWEPYVTQVTTADGRIVDALDETKIDLVFVIRAEVSTSGLFKIGNQEVRVGKDYIVKTRYIEINSAVERIEFVDGRPED